MPSAKRQVNVAFPLVMEHCRTEVLQKCGILDGILATFFTIESGMKSVCVSGNLGHGQARANTHHPAGLRALGYNFARLLPTLLQLLPAITCIAGHSSGKNETRTAFEGCPRLKEEDD